MKLRITDFRERAKMSQQDLAKKIGVSPKTIWNWEQGVCLCRS